MAAWLIKKDPNVRQYWRRLLTRPQREQAAFAHAERLLSDEPYPLDHPPGTISHLKGQFNCNHEYRSLPNAQRIYYKIWTRDDIEKAIQERRANIPLVEQWDEEALGVVVMFYAGPHPKEK